MLIALALSLCLLLNTKVTAAACTNTTNYGTVTSTVALPMSGDYTIWTRIQIPDSTNNYVQLEVDGGSCYQVGGNIPANAWTWIDYQVSGQNNKVKQTFTGGNHQVKLIGVKAGVKVDKIILLGTDETCETNGTTPIGDGSNCSKAASASVPSNSGGSPTTAPTEPATPAKGTISPPIIQSGNIKKVEYYVNDKLVQTSDSPVPFDTTLLDNGEHILKTNVTYEDGTTATEVSKLEVDNPTNPLIVTRRWTKRNKRLLIILSSTLGTVAAGAAVWYGLRTYRARSLFIRNHGLSK